MNEEAIDLKDVLERVQDDRDLLMELLQIYTEDFVEKKKLLDEAVTKSDYDQIKNFSHALKGASGNISAKKLHTSFLTLEQMAKNKDLSQSPKLLSEINQQFSELKDYIVKLKK